jgi:AcrR family transcriptional regulator
MKRLATPCQSRSIVQNERGERAAYYMPQQISMRSSERTEPERTSVPGETSGRKPCALRIRMAPQDREKLIVEHAMRFFALNGLEGQTRELARSLGITQSLIYRYFPSKEALIERVYEKWFADYWDPGWEAIIRDRTHPLETRLLQLYHDYVRVTYNDVHVRLFMHSALKRLPYHARFVGLSRSQLYTAIAAELRFDHALPRFADVAMTEFEGELIWAMHATVFQLGQRRWVYNLPVPQDIDVLMAARVHAYIASAPAQVASHLASLQSLKLASD